MKKEYSEKFKKKCHNCGFVTKPSQETTVNCPKCSVIYVDFVIREKKND